MKSSSSSQLFQVAFVKVTILALLSFQQLNAYETEYYFHVWNAFTDEYIGPLVNSRIEFCSTDGKRNLHNIEFIPSNDEEFGMLSSSSISLSGTEFRDGGDRVTMELYEEKADGSDSELLIRTTPYYPYLLRGGGGTSDREGTSIQRRRRRYHDEMQYYRNIKRVPEISEPGTYSLTVSYRLTEIKTITFNVVDTCSMAMHLGAIPAMQMQMVSSASIPAPAPPTSMPTGSCNPIKTGNVDFMINVTKTVYELIIPPIDFSNDDGTKCVFFQHETSYMIDPMMTGDKPISTSWIIFTLFGGTSSYIVPSVYGPNLPNTADDHHIASGTISGSSVTLSTAFKGGTYLVVDAAVADPDHDPFTFLGTMDYSITIADGDGCECPLDDILLHKSMNQ